MMRRLFTLASAVSLTLCLATVVLWIRSYRVSDDLWYLHTHWGVSVSSEFDRLQFRWWSAPEPDDLGVGGGHDANRAEWSGDPPELALGFGRTLAGVSDSLGNTHTEPIYWCPHWFLVALFALIPLLRIRDWLSRHGHRQGRCAHCGYDLRATPSRCPECGAIPEPRKATA
jgi:hypothetical protein